MWCWEAGAVNPDALCASLQANHFNWIAIKAHDGTSDFNDSAAIERYRAAAHKHHLHFGLWGYLTARDPSGEARAAVRLCKQHGADFYLADAEIEYEHAQGPVSQEFVSAFRSGAPHLPACLSTFGRLDYHPAINYRAWRDGGFDIMPQAYQCESLALTPRACLDSARAFWPTNRVYMTLGSYGGARGVMSGTELYDSVAGLALPGVNVWDAQELHAGQVEALSHLIKATPPPRPKPPPHVTALRFPRDPPRTLKLTSPLTRGQDVKDLKQAINIWSKAHGGPVLKEDLIFGKIALHATGVTAYAEGLLDTSASKDTIRKIWHPWLRTPQEVARGKQRRARHVTGGLAALPGIAARYIGTEERPAGSNEGYPFPSGWEEHFGMNGVSWCGCFAGSMILQAGGHVNSRVAYCPYIEDDARSKSNGFDLWVPNHDQGVGPGWLVLYCWDGSGVPEHVGIVESIHADHLIALEGNTGGSDPAAGGMVARVTRPYGPTVGYARPLL